MTRPRWSLALLLFLGAALIAPARGDGGTQIANCISRLPAVGGVCDFRNRGALSAAETITIDKPVTLLLDGTQLTVNGEPGMFVDANGVRVEGTAGQTRLIQGGSLGNTAYDRNVITGKAVEDFEVRGIEFVGISCSTPQDNNSGIRFQNVAPGHIGRIRVDRNTFTGFCLHAVFIQNATDVEVSNNVVAGVSYGIRFSGVVRGRIIDNIIRDTQMQNNGPFTVAIGLDTTAALDDGVRYPICSDVHISKNTIRGYVNGEGIMVHAGSNIIVSDNIMDDVLMGIGVNPFTSTDRLYNVVVTGNSYIGTMTPGAQTSTANYGVFVGGSAKTVIPSYVVVSHNVLSRANEIARSPGQGGIGVGYANDVIVEGNLIHDTVANGISLTNPNKHILVQGNYIENVSGPNSNGIVAYHGEQTGQVRSNFVAAAENAYRFDAASPELRYGINDSSEVTNAIVGGRNVAVVP